MLASVVNNFAAQ
uniref:Uncharacterized protein n=1 Tax=Arundo donax TaxID=35708 RepID=A0A0A9GC87_ARUDO